MCRLTTFVFIGICPFCNRRRQHHTEPVTECLVNINSDSTTAKNKESTAEKNKKELVKIPSHHRCLQGLKRSTWEDQWLALQIIVGELPGACDECRGVRAPEKENVVEDVDDEEAELRGWEIVE